MRPGGKALGSTEEERWEPTGSGLGEERGMSGGAVECVEIGQNTRGEGGALAEHRR